MSSWLLKNATAWEDGVKIFDFDAWPLWLQAGIAYGAWILAVCWWFEGA